MSWSSLWPQLVRVLPLSVCFLLQNSALLIQSSSTTIVSTRLLAHQELSANLATLPFSLIFVTAALGPPVFSLAIEKLGFRWPFLAGSLCGLTGGLLAVMSIYSQSFPLLCVASAILGIPNTAGNLFRFAATTLVDPQHASKAISAVLFSGLIGSWLGPFIADTTYQLFPQEEFEYMPVYICVCGLYVILAVVILVMPFKGKEQARVEQQAAQAPKEDTRRLLAGNIQCDSEDGDGPGEEEEDQEGEDQPASVVQRSQDIAQVAPRTWPQLMRSPGILVAISSAAVAYLSMISIMVMVPVVMDDNEDFSFADATNVMTVHGVGMYAPFFVTAFIIERTGVLPVIVTGLLLLASAIALFLSSAELGVFYAAMVVLGLGWSLSFIGSTVLLTQQYRHSAERPLAQSTNDVVVFGLVALATICSSSLYHELGWAGYLHLMLGLVLGALTIVLIWAAVSWVRKRKG